MAFRWIRKLFRRGEFSIKSLPSIKADMIILDPTDPRALTSANISVSPAVTTKLDVVLDGKISSVKEGDWKKVVSIEYNSVTGLIRFLYDDV